MKKIVLFVVGYLFYSLGLFAQENPNEFGRPNSRTIEINELKVGDKVPNLEFGNMLNYKSKRAKLSDFKGKLVILDMWSTWCSSCIATFPKLESLQKEFDTEIQILLVNSHDPKYDSEMKIKSTLELNRNRTGFYPSLPIPIHDIILNSYFPHRSVPHQVWISSDGRVVAITRSKDVTKENIQAFLKGKGFNVPVKDDWYFDKSKPLLVDNNGGNNSDFIFRSIFTGYKEGIGYSSGIRRNKDNQVIGRYLLNKSILHLISLAHSNTIKGFKRNRILTNVRNRDQFKWDFDPAYAYCYDLIIPAVPYREYYDLDKHLKDDLERVFNIAVDTETREMRCIVISGGSKVKKKLSSKYDKPDYDLKKTSIKKFIHNYSISEVINFLDRFDLPLVNETDSNSRIDVDFPDNFDLTDRKKVLDYFEIIGFDVQEEERQLEVVVISDTK